MEQQRLNLVMGMLEAPRAVLTSQVKACKTYRDAVRMCFGLRRIHHMSLKLVAERGGFTYQHVSDWLNKDDKPTRRDLPAKHIAAFESIMGNTLISQWLAAQSRLTVLEEMQAERVAA